MLCKSQLWKASTRHTIPGVLHAICARAGIVFSTTVHGEGDLSEMGCINKSFALMICPADRAPGGLWGGGILLTGQQGIENLARSGGGWGGGGGGCGLFRRGVDVGVTDGADGNAVLLHLGPQAVEEGLDSMLGGSILNAKSVRVSGSNICVTQLFVYQNLTAQGVEISNSRVEKYLKEHEKCHVRWAYVKIHFFFSFRQIKYCSQFYKVTIIQFTTYIEFILEL